MLRQSAIFAFTIDTTLNEAGAPRVTGETPSFNGAAATVSIPFRVREIRVRATTSFFTTAGVFVKPDSTFLLYSNIAGSNQPIGWLEHDDELTSGVNYKFDVNSMLDIRGSYVFSLRALTGKLAVVDPNPAIAPQFSGACNVIIDFIA